MFPEGSGVLFFDFYRVLRDLQALNGSTHLFWLYENVASMRCAYRAVISRFLQVASLTTLSRSALHIIL